MRFNENHKLSDVISEHYELVLLLSRFGIPLGFGDKTVAAVCADNDVDCKTFLAVVNYVTTHDSTLYEHVSVPAMTKFLRTAHHYYTDYLIPTLRAELINVTNTCADKKTASLVVKLYDSYCDSVRKHLAQEDNTLFAQAEKLAENPEEHQGLNLAQYVNQHDSIDDKLSELKNVIIRYYPTGQDMMKVNHVLYAIFAFEADLRSHTDIEDNLLLPAVAHMDNQPSTIRTK